ncbi:SMI1/KNR4 family protein [Metabacillus fastidiosus]|uniref:SMI1/KNR4 family protein n=1 Tax=Metabacillus fastidiosus TaxID=1458 RepID=UPI002E24099F|nr:SMI1/KNR4 family protein [Metabacillus fastidiosus]
MRTYKDIMEKVYKNPRDYKFNKISESTRKQIVEFTGIPQDYTDFLKEVGYGSVGDSYFMFYEGVIEAEEIFDTEENGELNNVLLLGDNFSGDAVGFLTTDNWSIVEVWHEDLSIVPREEKTFKQFVRNVFLKEM